MKSCITLVLLLVCGGLWAQAPESFKYQAVLRDANGNVKANTPTTLVLSLLEGASTGTIVYSETHTAITNEFGLVNLTIGNGTNRTGTVEAIDWSSNNYFLKVTIDGTDFGTSQLLSVPYALFAKESGNGFSGDYNDLTNKPTAATTTENGLMTATDKLKLEGIAAGAEVNVNADWSATTGDGLILNKPTLFNGSFTALTGKPTTIAGYGITDAFSGNYNDLTGRPTFNAPLALSAGTVSISPDGISSTHIGANAVTSSEVADRTIAPIDLANAISVGQILKYTSANTWSYATDENTTYTAGTGLSLAGTVFSIAGPVTVPNGGTGASSLTGILVGNGTGAFTGVTHSGSNQYLRRNSANSAYEFGTLSAVAGSGDYNDLSNRPTTIYVGTATTATGYQALNSVTHASGYANTAYGNQALYSNTQGLRNTASGYQSLYLNTTGDNNTSVGSEALYSNVDGGSNTAVGFAALYSNTTGINNTASGIDALYANTTGSYNTAFGISALLSNRANSRTTAIGSFALRFADNRLTGRDTYNTAVGYEALRGSSTPSVNTGQYNTAVGDQALVNSTSGNNNTAIGYLAGSGNSSGSNNVFIGNSAQVPSGTSSNQVRIGNSAITYAGIQVAWTVTSDSKWKEFVRELPYGLDFVNQMKPVDYIRKGNESRTREAGFIAQDVEATFRNLGVTDTGMISKGHDGSLELRYNDFIPILTKAIQEQQKQIEELRKENDQLKVELDQRIQKLEALLIAKGD